MPIVSYVRSFHERRISVPVDRDALVLDVGSGDKPSWRADVLLDEYPEDTYSAQRSGTKSTKIDRPLFKADAANMPFADQVFDYVICSHLLEHVPDPAAVISELTRVARAGYIEVPEAPAAKILDFPTHLWWCRLDDSEAEPTLVLEAKTTPYFDAEIDDYLRRAGLEKKVGRMLASRFEHNVVSLRWQGHVPHRVEGTPDPEFVRRVMSSDAPQYAGIAVAARVLTTLMTGRGHRPRPLHMNELMRPELRTGGDELLTNRVYDLSGR